MLSGDGLPPALLADERPAETTARVLSRLGLDATRRDTGSAFGAVMGLSVWPAVLERALREGAPVAARGVSPNNAAAFFAHRRAAMQHFDECVAELLEALAIEAGEEGARRQLLARDVQEALARVREPMPPVGSVGATPGRADPVASLRKRRRSR
ncbi:MAG: hypothetical protein IPN16_01915 [Gemmatimonadetes bacterium]|nr:hypothetical protein [Gemmatimonadota bacterium]